MHEDVQAMSTCCEEMTNRLKVSFILVSINSDTRNCVVTCIWILSVKNTIIVSVSQPIYA